MPLSEKQREFLRAAAEENPLEISPNYRRVLLHRIRKKESQMLEDLRLINKAIEKGVSGSYLYEIEELEED